MTNARRTFQDDSGPYVLPNDSEEHARLDRQCNAFHKIMGKIFHAPLDKPKRILDVGCGTGILTVQLAKLYPDAEVIGVDIAAVPVHRHGDLPNVKYVQGDIAKLVEDNSALLAPDWPNHVQRLVSLVSPGGFIELHDMSFEMFAGPDQKNFSEGTNMTATWEWHKHFARDCKADGLDIFCGRNLGSWLAAAGATNTDEHVYRISPGGPQLDESDQAYWEKATQSQVGLVEKVCSRQNSPEVVGKLQDEARATMGDLRHGDWAPLYVALGRVA